MTKQALTRYLLDTNTVSYFLKGDETVRTKIMAMPMQKLSISAVTKGELLFGLARRPQAKLLHRLVHAVLIRIEVLSWDSTVAEYYGTLRATLQIKGQGLGNLDLLIAAHALATERIIVTNDRAFTQIEGLVIENWLARSL